MVKPVRYAVVEEAGSAGGGEPEVLAGDWRVPDVNIVVGDHHESRGVATPLRHLQQCLRHLRRIAQSNWDVVAITNKKDINTVLVKNRRLSFCTHRMFLKYKRRKKGRKSRLKILFTVN